VPRTPSRNGSGRSNANYRHALIQNRGHLYALFCCIGRLNQYSSSPRITLLAMASPRRSPSAIYFVRFPVRGWRRYLPCRPWRTCLACHRLPLLDPSKMSSSTRPERVAAPILMNAAASPHVKGWRLSTELTSKLLGRSRAEGTTVHGALCAALVLAGRQIFSTWNNPIRIHSAVDARRLLQVGDNYMQLAFGGIVAVDPHTMSDFWDIARFIKRGLAPAQSLEGVIAGLGGLNDLLLQGLDSQTFSQVARESHAHEATLTNLGNLPFGTSFGDLKLTSMWGPAINVGAENGQTVGAATANGSLCLLHTSCTLAPSLLQVMEQLLGAACTHTDKA
jgi:hypothetical protein